MAFGLFRKKKNPAEQLYINASLVTDDEELAGCSWIAVKGGRIMAIGEEDSWRELEGPGTEVFDLEGRYLSPGLVQAFSDPSEEIFGDAGLKADPSWDRQTLMENISKWREEHAEAGYCFVYGAGMQLFKDAEEGEEEGFTAALDKAAGGLPAIVMFEDGLSLRLDRSAADMVTARADELMVRTISPELALDTVIAVDYASRALPLMEKSMELASKGVTAVFATPSNNCFGKLYKDLLIDSVSCGMLKQRVFGSTVLNRMIAPATAVYMLNRARTECTELDNNINYDTLVINASSDKDSFRHFSPEYLRALLADAADRGFSARIRAFDKETALTALEIMGELSETYKKQSFILMHGEDLSEEEKSEIFTGKVAEYPLDGSVPQGEDFWQQATAKAAAACAAPHLIGSLEEGKLADFAVFDEDPRTAASFAELDAFMTVLSGRPVYKKGEDRAEDWAAALSEQLEDFALDLAVPEDEEPADEDQTEDTEI